MCLPWRTSWYFDTPRALEDPRREWRMSVPKRVNTSFPGGASPGLVFPRPRMPGPPPERPQSSSDHPASSDIRPLMLASGQGEEKQAAQAHQEEGRVGENVLLLLFSPKKKERKNTYCCYFFKTWLCIMTAQCGKFRHFKKYDMKTF